MEEKEEFYVDLGRAVDSVKGDEILVVCGDFNGHVGECADGFEDVHGGKGFGNRNVEGEMLLELAQSRGLIVANTWYDKGETRKVSYESGGNRSVVDYVMLRREQRAVMTDVGVIAGETCVPQHKLMVSKLRVKVHRKLKKEIRVGGCRTWKLKEGAKQEEFRERLQAREREKVEEGVGVEGLWTRMKEDWLKAADEVCGRTKGPPRHRETWWWNEECDRVVREKRNLYRDLHKLRKGDRRKKEWQGLEAAYGKARREAKKVIGKSKEKIRKEWGLVLDRAATKGQVFQVVKQMVGRTKDIVGGGSIRNGEGKIVVEKDEMKEVWRSYYARLLNEEFCWDRGNLIGREREGRVVGEEIVFGQEEVREAIRNMKTDKAAGPTGLVAEMIQAAGDEGVRMMQDLCNEIVREKKMPADWGRSWIVNIYKGKGDALECGSYRGVKLLEHAMKVFERVVEARLRSKVRDGSIKIDNMQFGFRQGRGTTDAIFIVRQIQEKYRGKGKDLWVAFIDLEKAFDRVPREVLWWALRQVGVEEGMIRLIQVMYTDVTTAVRVQGGESDYFGVKVGVHQGSVLSPLLFIMVMEALSRECREGLPYELLYAD